MLLLFAKLSQTKLAFVLNGLQIKYYISSATWKYINLVDIKASTMKLLHQNLGNYIFRNKTMNTHVSAICTLPATQQTTSQTKPTEKTTKKAN